MNTALVETVQRAAAQLPAAALFHPSFCADPHFAGGRGRGRYNGPGDRAAAAQREPPPSDLEFVAELKGHTRKVGGLLQVPATAAALCSALQLLLGWSATCCY